MKKSELKQLIQEVITESRVAEFYMEIDQFVINLSEKYRRTEEEMRKSVSDYLLMK